MNGDHCSIDDFVKRQRRSEVLRGWIRSVVRYPWCHFAYCQTATHRTRSFRALTTSYYLCGLTLCIFVVIYEIRIIAQRREEKAKTIYVVFIVSEIKIDSGWEIFNVFGEIDVELMHKYRSRSSLASAHFWNICTIAAQRCVHDTFSNKLKRSTLNVEIMNLSFLSISDARTLSDEP